MIVLAFALAAAMLAGPEAAQLTPPPAKGGGDAVQHGAQPNPDEVRPGNRDGDAPSAAAGELVHKSEHRVLGLPVTTVLVVVGALLALAILAGLVIEHRRRNPRPPLV
ncbi:MAG TPA: hypothetical protein VFV05_16300 [Methylomirabilota bacterium]|nr:hypothetical protein [Methylomirabilota bacterium]